jgi:hypothetical protein
MNKKTQRDKGPKIKYRDEFSAEPRKAGTSPAGHVVGYDGNREIAATNGPKSRTSGGGGERDKHHTHDPKMKS